MFRGQPVRRESDGNAAILGYCQRVQLLCDSMDRSLVVRGERGQRNGAPCVARSIVVRRRLGFLHFELDLLQDARFLRHFGGAGRELVRAEHERQDVGVLLSAQASRARSAASRCGPARTDRRWSGRPSPAMNSPPASGGAISPPVSSPPWHEAHSASTAPCRASPALRCRRRPRSTWSAVARGRWNGARKSRQTE